jgi:hypothetical protein
MKWNAVLLVALVLGAVGCSKSPALKQPPVSVSGRVTQGGQPVGDVVVSFHPLDNGHLCSFPVKPDGTFDGDLIVGNYAYYVGPSSAPTSQALMAKIDAKYYQPDLGRSVSIEPGKEIVLALD